MNIDEVNELKKEVLVFDIETSSDYDLKSQSELYIADAKCKWIGFYSYKTDKYYELQVTEQNKETIKSFIESHKVLVGWNSNSFDLPIVKNNYLFPKGYRISLDLKEILKEKKRAIIMGYKFKSYSLRNVARDMDLPTQKGDIDYNIFKKDIYTDEETTEIKKYLRADVECTKLVFDYMFEMFSNVSEFVTDKNITNWSWLGCASGSLSYKVICGYGGLDEQYGQYDPTAEKEDVGGFVIEPTAEEQTMVWYKDFASLYPSIIIMFNMFGHPNLVQSDDWFEGNELFPIKGKYDKSKKHNLTNLYEKLFKDRKPLKLSHPHKAQTYKIIMNGGYGVLRSSYFMSTYYQYTGTDICEIGQRLNKLTGVIYKKYGFNTIFGDTDSRGFVHENKELSIDEQLKLMKLADAELYKTVADNVPFPFDGFSFDSETGDYPVVWMGFNYDKTKKVYKKKSYALITKKDDSHKVKLVGLPIIKDNATKLSMKIFKNEIEPRMLKELHGKFEECWVKSLVQDYIKDNWEDLGVNYNCNPASTYATMSQLQAQLSLNYFNGGSGSIVVYKNKKFGKVGKALKYCTLEECKEHNITWSDLDLTKLYNELEPFVKGGFTSKNRTVQLTGYF
jgi:DNA polymerase elongation subunit (family B)